MHVAVLKLWIIDIDVSDTIQFRFLCNFLRFLFFNKGFEQFVVVLCDHFTMTNNLGGNLRYKNESLFKRKNQIVQPLGSYDATDRPTDIIIQTQIHILNLKHPR